MKKLLISFIILILFTSCDWYEQDEYEEFYVVEAYLIADNYLPTVLLSTTSPVEEEYHFDENAIKNAAVEIRLLHADSTVKRRYNYKLKKPGIYIPINREKVQDQQLYQLLVRFQDGHTIEAKTYVPKNFSISNTMQLDKDYVYQGSKKIKVSTTLSDYITGRQAYYIFNVKAVEPDSTRLTPFYNDIVMEKEVSIKNFYNNSSGIINQDNYEVHQNQSITLTLPWISVAFFGENNLILNAIDDNLYDFIRTGETQTDSPTLSPGEIQNTRYHISGGIGIFGSLARDTNHVTILRSNH